MFEVSLMQFLRQFSLVALCPWPGKGEKGPENVNSSSSLKKYTNSDTATELFHFYSINVQCKCAHTGSLFKTLQILSETNCAGIGTNKCLLRMRPFRAQGWLRRRTDITDFYEGWTDKNSFSQVLTCIARPKDVYFMMFICQKNHTDLFISLGCVFSNKYNYSLTVML